MKVKVAYFDAVGGFCFNRGFHFNTHLIIQQLSKCQLTPSKRDGFAHEYQCFFANFSSLNPIQLYIVQLKSALCYNAVFRQRFRRKADSCNHFFKITINCSLFP